MRSLSCVTMDFFDCPQCGEEAEVFVEGYCSDCSKANYDELHTFNQHKAWWDGLTDEEKGKQIDQACISGKEIQNGRDT